MKVKEIAKQAGTEIAEIESKIADDSINKFMDEINKSNKIYVCGAGRSLLMLRCLAMRLMHIGYNAYVVGDTTTPAFEENDLLIIGSASGETTNLVSITKRAKGYGGRIVTCSIFENSNLARIADVFIKIPAFTDKLPENNENKRNILPGGSMFEICMLVMFDSMIIPLAKQKEISTSKSFSRHANLE